jgi:multiple sugar transport system permease protein
MTMPATKGPLRRRTLVKWLFVTPALLYMLLFFGYPLIRNVVMSFQDYSFATYFTGEAPFNGLENWRLVFANELFGASLWHTLLFTLGSLAGQFSIGMALALFFSRRFPLSGLMRSLLLLPWLIPMVVAGTVWRRILDQESGVLNESLQALHLTSSAVPWLSSPDYALLSVVLVNIWIGIPFNMVIPTAASRRSRPNSGRRPYWTGRARSGPSSA